MTPDGRHASAVLEPVLVSGVLAFLARPQGAGAMEGLADLAAELSKVLLAPYVGGPGAAHRIAMT